MGETVNVLSISGGKDSAAMWIYAVKELGVEVMPVFADTGNEHPETYAYVDYLEKELGPIKRVKADFSRQIERKKDVINTKWRREGVSEDIINTAFECLTVTGNPFLDLCIWKGRFPSSVAKFCTQELKIIPVLEQIYLPLLEAGHKVMSWQGVRAEESARRAKMDVYEETPEGFTVYRPILNWLVQDVFHMHGKYGIQPNPLYKLGMSRVGCMPCINVNKGELFEISRRFPDEIERIAQWEKVVATVSKLGKASFLPALEGSWKKDIYDWVEWSKTHGGHNYDLLKMVEMEDEPSQCSSVYGLCE